MPLPRYIHLRLHSEYSIVDSIVRIEQAIDAAIQDAMPGLALTDLNNVFGLIKFYKVARAKGCKPILGCDAYVSNETDRDQPHRILLLCQNHTGYLRLCEWLSRAYKNNQHRGRAELRREWLIETAGLLALSGAQYGDVGQAILSGNQALAERHARFWQERFPDRYYLELQRTGQSETETCVQAALSLAAQLNLPVVATHPVQFLRRDEYKAHEARVCIATGYTLTDQRRPKLFTPEHYFKTQAEMIELFADLPQALDNTIEIAKRCNLTIALGKNYLPAFPTPVGQSLAEHLAEQAERGLQQRLPVLAEQQGGSEYRSRLSFEINTITQMGYAGYFLIVADFINWAKQNGVPVGPGRGSGAGSLVAYALGITDLDPIQYSLLFERFLNPERVSMPDFDIDFCMEGRDRVIDYVKQKYGEHAVSQIATFGTMAAKAVVRDVGRVLDLPYSFVDGIAKLIPFQPGKLITLKMAREMEPLLAEREKKEEEVAELLALAEHLEGLTRNVGMHAGGVLIAPGQLTDYCPLYAAAGVESLISQFDKDDVEQIGLVKFDFLGLRTLTIIDWAVRLIRKQIPEFSLATISLNDPATFKLLKAADTTAVFQLESRGMRDLMKRMQPDRFDDIIALVALFRPGPMNLIDDFVKRKHGTERVFYLDPRLEPILAPTYGVMVYQEQVMQIAQVIAVYSLGNADLLRRAMGKKKADEMAAQRFHFVKGALERGMKQTVAEQLFDQMEKFAEYGFNKSHSAAYALIAYQTAYLKTHYASAFMAATLSSEMDDTDKIKILVDDCLHHGLRLLPPDVNCSEYRFVPIDQQQIRYGLGAVKGTGEAACKDIIQARSEQPFTSFIDFCQRIDSRTVNRRTIEALIRAGAFDSLEDCRASLLASAGAVLGQAERSLHHLSQGSLFGDEISTLSLIKVKPWNDGERLQQEKLSLGFYFSGHPFKSYQSELSSLIRLKLAALTPQSEPVRIAGMISALRSQMTRRGKMAFITLDDGSAQIEISVFNELFEAHRLSLKEDQVIIIEGKISDDPFTGGIRVVADALYDLTSARNKFAKQLRLSCNGTSFAHKLQEILQPYRSGQCPVTIIYQSQQTQGELELGGNWRVNLQDNLIASLKDWLLPENVQIIY